MFGEDEPQGWDAASADTQRAMVAGWEAGFGLPHVASAIYGRWWQLETWLRSLCYVEMRAKYGGTWDQRLSQQVEKRGQRDRQHSHMSSPDANDQLAFLDTSGLLDVIEGDWGVFDGSLLPMRVWGGRMEELLNIRNRVGHCRRPHSDDLMRLEQMLRDLEPGALRAILAYTRKDVPEQTLDDPLVDAWSRGGHATARRLIQHATNQYNVRFQLCYSIRPWAKRDEGSAISGQAGALWHACWYVRTNPVDIKKLWDEYPIRKLAPLVVFVDSAFLGRIDISFPAVDDPDSIADAIGFCFDAILTSIDYYGDYEDHIAKWKQQRNELGPIVQISSPWNSVDDSMIPISIFGA
jgi:hypothetical protein